MDITVKRAIMNIGSSYRFLSIAVSFGSDSVEYYKKRHLHYLEVYKNLTGEEFIYPKGVRNLL